MIWIFAAELLFQLGWFGILELIKCEDLLRKAPQAFFTFSLSIFMTNSRPHVSLNLSSESVLIFHRVF